MFVCFSTLSKDFRIQFVLFLRQFRTIFGLPPPRFRGSRYLPAACRSCCHAAPGARGRRVPASALTTCAPRARRFAPRCARSRLTCASWPSPWRPQASCGYSRLARPAPPPERAPSTSPYTSSWYASTLSHTSRMMYSGPSPPHPARALPTIPLEAVVERWQRRFKLRQKRGPAASHRHACGTTPARLNEADAAAPGPTDHLCVPCAHPQHAAAPGPTIFEDILDASFKLEGAVP